MGKNHNVNSKKYEKKSQPEADIENALTGKRLHPRHSADLSFTHALLLISPRQQFPCKKHCR
jgi:hypothetical protein